jgi:hypothetical protein
LKPRGQSPVTTSIFFLALSDLEKEGSIETIKMVKKYLYAYHLYLILIIKYISKENKATKLV